MIQSSVPYLLSFIFLPLNLQVNVVDQEVRMSLPFVVVKAPCRSCRHVQTVPAQLYFIFSYGYFQNPTFSFSLSAPQPIIVHSSGFKQDGTTKPHRPAIHGRLQRSAR
jgi:hypothetical protein